MRSRPRLWPCALLSTVLLAGCASPLDGVALGAPGALERVILRHYERYATEEYGRCSRAYIDGITAAQVVEQAGDRVALDVRYFYRDRLRGGSERDGSDCLGFGERRFVVDRGDAGLEVVEMSGPQRGRRAGLAGQFGDERALRERSAAPSAAVASGAQNRS